MTLSSTVSKSQRGFTLIELVTVMVILAGLGAMLLPRFAHNDATLPAQADQVGRVLRHAQALAMTQGRPLTFAVLSSTSYAITDGLATIRNPAGENQSYTLANSIAFTSGGNIKFDSLGRPMSGASLASTAQSWALNGSATITLAPVTGFVTVSP